MGSGEIVVTSGSFFRLFPAEGCESQCYDLFMMMIELGIDVRAYEISHMKSG